ncbi:hypothetical protein M569_00179 [Genlisea aurea]|uniref:Uncharacterized protein n=1 Tax=Genlisea aurea TaxID=192259 RepID=S8D581_9LAMI|nr:hypothetical protein M569_00179 [Genlisea aurea]
MPIVSSDYDFGYDDKALFNCPTATPHTRLLVCLLESRLKPLKTDYRTNEQPHREYYDSLDPRDYGVYPVHDAIEDLREKFDSLAALHDRFLDTRPSRPSSL